MKKSIVALSGNKCAFPGCGQDLIVDGEAFIGELASIEVINRSSPRFNPNVDRSHFTLKENFLLLCPNHHSIIDRQPQKYTVKWLRDAREKHLKNVAEALGQGSEQPKFQLPPQVELSLNEALELWNSSKENPSEEFWQKVFEQCPMVIAQLFPRSMFQLGKKCYVGGKSLDNAGGNLVDFVYANKKTNNVVLIEIKTPKTRLLGKRYRENAYAISGDLSGSIVQVLNYKDSLVKEYYSLADEDNPFSAFSPKCVVVAGSIDGEMDSGTKLKSFELFRNEGSAVDLITYDELFDKVQTIIDMIS